MKYEYEAYCCNGKFEAESDHAAILKFRKYGIVRVWRIEGRKRILILKRRNKK